MLKRVLLRSPPFGPFNALLSTAALPKANMRLICCSAYRCTAGPIPMLKPVVQVTDKAYERLRQLLKKQEGQGGIKIGIKREGCNGLTYTMNYTTDCPGKPGSYRLPSGDMVCIVNKNTTVDRTSDSIASAADSIAGTASTGNTSSGNASSDSRGNKGEVSTLADDDTSSNVAVVVDKAAVMYIIGTTLDFAKDPLSSHFVFNNPNKKNECGCGKSFMV